MNPRKEARVAEPSLRILAVGEAWIVSMSGRVGQSVVAPVGVPGVCVSSNGVEE